MRKYKVLAFGITREWLGARETMVECNAVTVGEFRAFLKEKYPAAAKLNSLMIAVNKQYGEDDQLMDEKDEIALIPPVSGG